MNHNKIFGAQLRALRRKARMTQEQLGFETDISRTYISLLERGERSPTLDTIVKLSNGLNISIAELVEVFAEKMENTIQTN